MKIKELDFSGLDDTNEGMKKAVDRIYRAIMNPGPIPPETHMPDRVIEAKEDYLDQIPGTLYRLMKEDIAAVWRMLESPIEQIIIFQLAAENYSNREGWPIYAKVCRERGMFSHKHYPVQLIPQVKFGPYRVDFLFDLGGRGLVAIECDGEEFHQDKERDRARDEHLREHYGVSVLRASGKVLWRNNSAATVFASVIKAKLL